MDDPNSSRPAKYISMFVMVIIALSVINFIVGTEITPRCGWVSSGSAPDDVAYECGDGKLSGTGVSKDVLNALETVCIMVFTVEYVLRIITCTTSMSLVSFIFAPMNIIDFVAIVPYYLDLILAAAKVSVSVEALSLLRVVRLTRVVRIFKMSKNFQGLIVLGRTLYRSLTAITLLLTFVITLIVIFATLIYQFESGEWTEDAAHPGWGTFNRADGKPSPFVSIFHSFYWVLVTMTTVGYGDMYPITAMGWVVAGLAMMSGLIVLTLPITIIGANFDEESREQHRINERRRRAENRKVHTELSHAGTSDVLAYNVPGFDDAAELVADHKNNVRNEMEGLMGKLEKDLTESLIKVILQSRVTKRKTDVRLRSPSVSPSGRRSGSCKSLFSAGSARSEASGVGSEEGAVPET